MRRLVELVPQDSEHTAVCHRMIAVSVLRSYSIKFKYHSD